MVVVTLFELIHVREVPGPLLTKPPRREPARSCGVGTILVPVICRLDVSTPMVLFSKELAMPRDGDVSEE
jgi:hypothetical protein